MIFNRLVANITGSTRHATMAGRDYLVAPMVMLAEGVHKGSNGSLYYPAAELKKNPAVWNHKPIVVYHPRNGMSACTPDILTKQSVGVIMNTKYKKGKLHAEAWLEVKRVEEVDPRVLENIESDTITEISTGLFTENEEEAGEWNGEEYTAIARNHMPDHLAILPDEIGAYSVADGGGLLRTNSQGKPIENKLLLTAVEEVTLRFNKKEAKSFSQVMTAVSAALREKLGDGWNGWTEDVFPTYVIYWDNGGLYRYDYSFADGVAAIEGSPVEVSRTVSYTAKAGTTNSNLVKEKTVTKKEKIDQLISNTGSGWVEANRVALDALPDAALDKVVANTAKPAPTPAPKADPPPVAPPVVNTAPPAVPTFAEVLNSASPEMREMITEGMGTIAAERTKLVTEITANAASGFTVDMLKGKPMAELRAIGGLVAKATAPAARSGAHYGGAQGAPLTDNASGEADMLAVPTMNFEEKAA